MRLRRALVPLLAVTLLASLPGVRIAPAQAATKYDVKTESFNVKTKYGDVYVEVQRPVDPKNPKRVVKAPAILTYSPYSILWVGLCGDRICDTNRWVPRGYARVWADVIGTGNSGGCWDYGGTAEKVSGYDLVEAIAKQPWSDGKVAMIGGSYEGTTAWATAVMHPPHLTTIVPEAAIARWYDYAFAGGIRYNDNNEAPREGPPRRRTRASTRRPGSTSAWPSRRPSTTRIPTGRRSSSSTSRRASSWSTRNRGTARRRTTGSSGRSATTCATRDRSTFP